MAWTYDASDLTTDTASGRLNTTRLLVGDTNTLDQQTQDEEITFALSESNDNVYYAAAWVSRTIASQYSRKVNTELSGALKADYSDLAKQYTKMAENLEYQGKKAGASLGVAAGGISKTTINTVRDNTDRVQGSFRRDRFKNPPTYTTPDYE